MAKGKREDKTKKPKRPKVAFVDSSELELLSLALRVVVEEKKVSAALIQRRLKVGYATAARLLDSLELLAVITPAKGGLTQRLTGYVPTLKAKPAVIKKVEPVKPKMGRPTTYNEKVVDEICRRLAAGESVLRMCRDDHMPNPATVYGWLLDTKSKQDFIDRYEAAKVVQAEVFHDELLEIADDSSQDKIETEIAGGLEGGLSIVGTQTDHEHINRARLRVDTRKWIIARMNPKKYGDKMDVTSGGKELKQPRPSIISYVIPKEGVKG